MDGDRSNERAGPRSNGGDTASPKLDTRPHPTTAGGASPADPPRSGRPHGGPHDLQRDRQCRRGVFPRVPGNGGPGRHLAELPPGHADDDPVGRGLRRRGGLGGRPRAGRRPEGRGRAIGRDITLDRRPPRVRFHGGPETLRAEHLCDAGGDRLVPGGSRLVLGHPVPRRRAVLDIPGRGKLPPRGGEHGLSGDRGSGGRRRHARRLAPAHLRPRARARPRPGRRGVGVGRVQPGVGRAAASGCSGTKAPRSGRLSRHSSRRVATPRPSSAWPSRAP